MIDSILSIQWIRQKILFKLKHKYFHEIGISIPLESGYWAHLLEKDSYDSFSEIFIKQEYLEFIPNIPISRILDIGSHYGYFSLWLQSIQPQIKLNSLLIEASPRCIRSLKSLTNQNKICGRFSYLQGAIDSPHSSATTFFDRPHMAGSRSPSDKSEEPIQVEPLTEMDIMEKLKPPYDLIKCDIEGAEWELLSYYTTLLKKTKYILLEWHSWHSGGDSCSQINDKLSTLGYNIIKSSSPLKAVGRDGEVGLLLAENMHYQN